MPYKEGKKWRATPQYRGERLPTKLFRSKKEAVEYEREAKKQKRKEQILPKGMDLLTLCGRYLDYAERFTQKTYKEKQALCKRVVKEWGPDSTIENITGGHVQSYLDGQAKKRSANASNKDRKNLISMWNFGCKFHGIRSNPTSETSKRAHNKGIQPVYTEEEVLLVLLAATREEKLILTTFIETAGRRKEIFNLTWDDVNIETQGIQMWTRKTMDGSMESEWLPISSTLADEFKWWLKARPLRRASYVFPNPRTGKPYIDPRKWLKRICERAGVECKGFHAFRRYVASILADKYKKSAKYIQLQLRHKKQSTTEIYIHQIHSSLRDSVGLAVPESIGNEKTTHKHYTK
ncbi:tyrosine-type recombinase/integrase [Thermodesulfobacteriota bacterium]